MFSLVAKWFSGSQFLGNLYKTLCQYLNISRAAVSENTRGPVQQKKLPYLEEYILFGQ